MSAPSNSGTDWVAGCDMASEPSPELGADSGAPAGAQAATSAVAPAEPLNCRN